MKDDEQPGSSPSMSPSEHLSAPEGTAPCTRALLKAAWVSPVIVAISLPRPGYATNISGGDRPSKPKRITAITSVFGSARAARATEHLSVLTHRPLVSEFATVLAIRAAIASYRDAPTHRRSVLRVFSK